MSCELCTRMPRHNRTYLVFGLADLGLGLSFNLPWLCIIVVVTIIFHPRTGACVMGANPMIGCSFVHCIDNVTVYLRSVASFTCKADLGDYDGIFWYATEEDTPHYVLPAEYGAVARTYDLPNNILSSTLTINARETTNNTRILCRGYRSSGQDIFSTAYMTVVGMDSDTVATKVRVQEEHQTTTEQLHTSSTILQNIVICGTSAAAVVLVLAMVLPISIMAVSFWVWRKKNARGIGIVLTKVVLQSDDIPWDIQPSKEAPTPRETDA